MKPLHLRAPKKYDYTDEKETENFRIKFFCIGEGPTEESYFEGVANHKRSLDIKSDVHIEVIPKQEGEESFSHPLQLVQACLRKLGRLNDQNQPIPKNQWKYHFQWEDYDDELDTVCVIFDRDYRDLDRMLEEIFALCEQHGIRIVLSNPNFELWLLMHYPEIEQYDPVNLQENRKNRYSNLVPGAAKDKKYLEILLSNTIDGYHKGTKIKFERFLEAIPLAIEQAGLFEQEADALRSQLGTGVGLLIHDMRTKC